MTYDNDLKVKIRPMDSDDIDGILTIDRKLSGLDRAVTYRDSVGSVLGGQIELSFVAEVDDQFAGFIMGSHTFIPQQDMEACVIQTLGIDPAYARHGLATRLIQALMDKCRTKGIRLAHIMIEETDKPMQALFKRFGFTPGNFIAFNKAL